VRLQPRQLDLLQEQARAGQLEAGWPIFRESDRLHCYLTGELPALAAWPPGRLLRSAGMPIAADCSQEALLLARVPAVAAAGVSATCALSFARHVACDSGACSSCVCKGSLQLDLPSYALLLQTTRQLWRTLPGLTPSPATPQSALSWRVPSHWLPRQVHQ
jgi:hypothetical protein